MPLIFRVGDDHVFFAIFWLYHISAIFMAASEGWGRYCFHRCVHTRVGASQSLVPYQVCGPRSFVGCTPIPGSFPGLWSQVISGVTPVLAGGTPVLGYPQPDRTGVPPSQDKVTPNWEWGSPQLGIGYHPGWHWGTPLQDRTAYGVLAMQHAVCLLRSHRGTFLLNMILHVMELIFFDERRF